MQAMRVSSARASPVLGRRAGAPAVPLARGPLRMRTQAGAQLQRSPNYSPGIC